ncbi:MAG: hypothetical protein HZB53_11615 [Chloroflexi bacterium]|nr:hypothetical protein [Chloroflexota bacterium]
MSNADRLVHYTGIDALTGRYLSEPVAADVIVARARAEYTALTSDERDALKSAAEQKDGRHLGFGVNLEDMRKARWGVILGKGEDPAVRTAVERLAAHRERQLGFAPGMFEVTDTTTAAEFLADHDVTPGTGEPKKVPYYLLIAGDPERVPFRLQFELDGEYATGRLCFPRAADYDAYVDHLIAYETDAAVPTRKEAAFWAPAHTDDRPTYLSCNLLAKPLHDGLDPDLGFKPRGFFAADALKANLAAQFAQARPPALVFTAGHGYGYRQPYDGQEAVQGALVTQEWELDTPCRTGNSFGGADATAANPHGMAVFSFACFSAGTPLRDDYAPAQGLAAPVIAARPFVAGLPMQLLARGALAFVGHVERARGYSYLNLRDRPSLLGFERALGTLLGGAPVGHSLRDIHDRAVQLSHQLVERMQAVSAHLHYDPDEVARWWQERNDARAHILLGDPGARLRVNDMTP